MSAGEMQRFIHSAGTGFVAGKYGGISEWAISAARRSVNKARPIHMLDFIVEFICKISISIL
jgi:hypothetical protein